VTTMAPESNCAPRTVSADAVLARASSNDAVVRQMYGIRFNDVTCEEFFALIDARIREGQYGYVVTPNVDHICLRQRHEGFRKAYDGAWLVLCDGMPLLWAARLLGKPLREKLSGSDLIIWLSGHAARKGYPVFLFGAKEGVGAEAAEKLRAIHPELKIAGVYSPPFDFQLDPEANAEAKRRLKESGASIVYVALGCPKQEVWLQEHGPDCGVPVMLGVGGSFEFVSGRVPRAPVWMQKSGLEWIWRLCQEPRRLWKRYLVDDMLFVKLFLKEFAATYLFRRG